MPAAIKLATVAICSATPASTIKSGQVRAGDVATATYQYLGCIVPRQKIDDKFGSYCGTMLGLAIGPASIAAATILSCALSGWQPAVLASGGALCLFMSFLSILDLHLKLSKIQDRSAVCSLLRESVPIMDPL